MMNKFSYQVQQAIQHSREEAIRLGHDAIGTEHLLLGLLQMKDCSASQGLMNLGVDLDEIRESVEEAIVSPAATMKLGNIPFSKAAEKALKVSYIEGKQYASEQIGTEHLLLALVKDEDGLPAQILSNYNVSYETLKAEFDNMSSQESPESGESGAASQRPASGKKKTPVLDHFGRDLTQLARESRLDPIIGRDLEIERVAQILSRRKKNNPVLIGEPGVGKTAIVEGLALRIINQKVSPALFNKRVIALDIGSMVAGTKYRGQFEERVKSVLAEIEKNPDVIIFIDELHTIVGAGSASGSLDASNMFKPALARGELQCIGATTLNEYRENIEKDGALERRFQKLMVDPPSVDETIEILQGLKTNYEEHHGVLFDQECLRQSVLLSDRYISDRFLPDKAIDVLDETGSRLRLQNLVIPEHIVELGSKVEALQRKKDDLVKKQEYEKAAELRDEKRKLEDELTAARAEWESNESNDKIVATTEDIAGIVSMMTGIPVNRVAVSEGQRLLKMRDLLKKSIVGQDEAIRELVKAIRRSRTGLKNPNRPIGSFIFLGPTGVGKTELANVLAEHLFGDRQAIVRVDMSEYMEKFNVSRLIGAPPGYVGYDEGGQLSERVRRKPYSVVLFDEVEKAHPDVFNMMLQVLDNGELTDGSRRKVDFRNTVIIMTSNSGSREAGKGSIGFAGGDGKSKTQQEYAAMKERMMKTLKDQFRPEFLNRIDETIVFHHLEREHIMKIEDIYLEDINRRLTERRIELKLSATAKDFIADKGFDVHTGARVLRRAVERHLEDPLAEEMLKGSIEDGDLVHVEVGDDELTFKSEKKALLATQTNGKGKGKGKSKSKKSDKDKPAATAEAGESSESTSAQT